MRLGDIQHAEKVIRRGYFIVLGLGGGLLIFSFVWYLPWLVPFLTAISLSTIIRGYFYVKKEVFDSEFFISVPENAYKSFSGYIGTFGYLYTLIGFSIAIFDLRHVNFDIGHFVGPLALSLLTSIVGWFFSSLISHKYRESKETDVLGAMKGLMADFHTFSKELRSVQDEYLETIKRGTYEFENLNKRQRKMYEEASSGTVHLESNLHDLTTHLSETLNSMKETLLSMKTVLETTSTELKSSFTEPLNDALKSIKTMSAELGKELGTSRTSVKTFRKYIDESSLLVEEFKILFDLVKAESERVKS